MKKSNVKNSLLKQFLAAKAEQALAQQLPVEQKTLRRVGRMMEPKNIKRFATVVVVGAVSLSLLNRISEMRMYRRAMARELKKQLEPMNKKLDELEAQNEELKRQNAELMERCK